jgi:hypothetical protein
LALALYHHEIHLRGQRLAVERAGAAMESEQNRKNWEKLLHTIYGTLHSGMVISKKLHAVHCGATEAYNLPSADCGKKFNDASTFSEKQVRMFVSDRGQQTVNQGRFFGEYRRTPTSHQPIPPLLSAAPPP